MIGIALMFLGTSCKKCQTCQIDYSYEYQDGANTVTETGSDNSGEQCGSKKDMDEMKQMWEQMATDKKTELEGQGGQNVSSVATCTMK